jgi:hypothetical protein
MLAADGCQMKPTSAELLGRCPLVPSPVSLAALKALLGHRDFALTLRYAHLAPDHLRAEMLKTEGAGHSPRSAQSRSGGPGALDGARAIAYKCPSALRCPP